MGDHTSSDEVFEARGRGGASKSSSSVGIVFSSAQIRRVRDLLARFYGVRKSARFYPPGHPAVHAAVDALMEVIAVYHAEGVDIPLTFFEDEVLLGEQLLPEESVLFDQLVRDMASIGAGSVTFRRGLQADELERAMFALSVETHEAARAGSLDAIVARAGLSNVDIRPVRVLDVVDAESPERTGEDAEKTYTGALDLMRELERLVRTSQAMFVGQMKNVARSLVDEVLANRYAMLQLSGLKDYDEYTFYHSVNVAILSLALGSCITRDRRFLTSLAVGALMHDIGKTSVDVAVLNKAGSLSSEEWAAVRRHPVAGAEDALALPGLDKSSVVIILEHHMRHDRTGYPQPGTRRRQHLMSRIVAVADAYDAMTSRRSYSAARLQDEAMSVLAGNVGTAFDPGLVRLFIGMLGVYPPRSVVRLSTGEVAVVTEPGGEDPLAPRVRVIADAGGAVIEPFDVDLAVQVCGPERTIRGCLDPQGMNVEVDDYL